MGNKENSFESQKHESHKGEIITTENILLDAPRAMHFPQKGAFIKTLNGWDECKMAKTPYYRPLLLAF